MRVVLALVGLVGAAVIAPAQTTDAPLAETKRQIQSLQKDRVAEKTGSDSVTNNLRGAITTVDPAAAIALPPPTTAKSPDERDGRQKDDSRRNWLLDGYDKLNPRRDGAAGTEPEEKPLDPADPDYFLRVYEKQRAEALRRRDAAAARETPPPTGGAQDTFAPFLQDWLAGSPVRDVLRDAAGGKAATSRIAGGDTTAGSASAPVQFNLPLEGPGVGQGGGSGLPSASPAAGPVATNPFVQALGLPATPEARALEYRPQPAPRNSTLLPVLPGLTPPPPDKPAGDARKVPPAPDKDAKKYFPQLKKF
jgi:hypothetical protein